MAQNTGPQAAASGGRTPRGTWTGRLVGAALLAAVSAGMLLLAFPPFGWWPLVFVAFVPMLLAQYRVMPAPLSSLASAIAIGGWVWGFFGPVFAGTGTIMRFLPLGVFVIVLVTDRGLRAYHERTGYRWLVLQGAVGWVGFEMIRALIPSFGTWGFLPYTLHAQTWLIQPVSVFGIFGLSLVVVAVNYALGLMALAAVDRAVPSWRGTATVGWASARRWTVATAVVLAAWIVTSIVQLDDPAPQLRVAAIQPAVSTLIEANRGREELAQATLRRMREQTLDAAREGARYIVWPEGALRYDPQVEDPLDLVGLAREANAYLGIGYVVNLAEGGFRNEATVIAPDGRFLGVFGKDHPVVFGGETSPTRGTYPVYETDVGRLGTMICYDLDFTDTARKLTRNGVQVLAVPSQDWAAIARLHTTHLVFRAIENRVSMVKADGSFDSVVVDPYGRVLAEAIRPEGGEATLVADVPLGMGNTLAVRWGDWLGWASLAGFVAFTVAPSIRRRRR